SWSKNSRRWWPGSRLRIAHSPPARCSISRAAERHINPLVGDIMTREGGCLCGAVRFKAEGEPINVRICHCGNCQKAMGSPFFARALFNQSDLTVQGGTARYASSEVLDRVFCKNCGTRLFGWRRNGTVAGVALAAFDDRNAFAPTEHIWVAEKMHWVRLNDGLPQHPGAA